MGQRLREECLQRLSVEEAAKKLGIEIKGREGDWLVACCPLHDDTRPSFRIAAVATSSAGRDHEKGFWICHARCGNGSIFDLVLKLGRVQTFGDAIRFFGGSSAGDPHLSDRSTNGHAARAPRARVAKEVASVVTPEEVEANAQTLLSHSEALAYLTQERGLSLQAIKNLKIGFVTRPYPAIVIPKPVRDPQHFKILPFPRPSKDSDAVRFRHTVGASTKLLYPTDDFGQAPVTEGLMASRVLVVESELDAALCADLGIKCVATGGTSNFTLACLTPLFGRCYLPVLAPDTDDSGRRALEKCSKSMTTEGVAFGVVILPLPEGCKDLGDAFKALGRDATKRWLIDAVEGAEFHGVADKNEKAKNTLDNLDAALALFSETTVCLWMNELGRIKMFGPRRLTDNDVSNLQVDLFKIHGAKWVKEEMQDRITSLCYRNMSHPVRDYLDSLKWDAAKRIDDLLGAVIAIGVDEDRQLKGLYLRKWLIGAVARVYEPGCKMDTMLVLYSEKQGIGKSKFAEVLGGPWYIPEAINPDDKDCKLTLHKNWIVEVDELDATTRKRDLASLRAFLSRKEDSIRSPYGRIDEVYKRSFVFVGTTNDKGVVKEEDGRRYWPIECAAFDIPVLAQIRDQVWAEAVALYKAGEKWWLEDADEERRRVDNAAKFHEDDPATEMIREWMDSMAWPSGGVSMDQVTERFKESGIDVNRKEVAHILRGCGLERVVVRVDGSRKTVRRWKQR